MTTQNEGEGRLEQAGAATNTAPPPAVGPVNMYEAERLADERIEAALHNACIDLGDLAAGKARDIAAIVLSKVASIDALPCGRHLDAYARRRRVEILARAKGLTKYAD